jgi:GNAT superfamily N-acetyltransferase
LTFKLSQAGPDDLDVLVAHRLGMWNDIHPELRSKVRGSRRATRGWIKRNLADGTLVGFIARTGDGKVAGSGCVWIRPEQPRPTSARQQVPYLMSMFTVKEYRRRGVARMIVKRALGWCKRHGYDRIVLHASKEGRALYERFGFEPTSEMRLRLE